MTSWQRSRLGVHLSDNVDIWWTDLKFVATENSFLALSGPCACNWRVVNVIITLSDPRYRLAEGYLPIVKISEDWRLVEIAVVVVDRVEFWWLRSSIFGFVVEFCFPRRFGTRESLCFSRINLLSVCDIVRQKVVRKLLNVNWTLVIIDVIQCRIFEYDHNVSLFVNVQY